MVETTFQTEELECDECGCKITLYDSHHDQVFCPECGMVLYEQGYFYPVYYYRK